MRRCDPQDLVGGFRQDTCPAPGTDVTDAERQASKPVIEAPEGSRPVAERVLAARLRSAARNPGGCCNAQLPAAALADALRLDASALGLWERAIRRRHLSARSGARMLRVARTISDLAGQERVGPEAVAEALTYRSFDGLGMAAASSELSGSDAGACRGRAAPPPGVDDGHPPHEDSRTHG
mgnify:FL=1